MERGNGYRKGLWTVEEDRILMEYVRVNGKGKWNRIPKLTTLKRCGKSCRLRWINYLSPSVNRSHFSQQEDDLIIRLHNLLGNRWSLIAGRVPGRTDNQVKNHWNTHLSKKLQKKKLKSKTGKASQTISIEAKEADHSPAPPPPPSHDKNGHTLIMEDVPRSITLLSDDNAHDIKTAIGEYESSPPPPPPRFSLLGDLDTLNAPNLMQFLDEHVLDFIWDAL